MSLIEKLIRPEIRQLDAYHVQDASGYIKLDAMENPYSFSEDLKEKWLQVLNDVEINRYPNPSPQDIKAELKQTFAIDENAEVLLGNGSDELIQILYLALSQKASGEKACVLAPDPGFVMYNMIAKYTNMDYVGVPLNADDFSLPVDAMLQAMEQHQPSLVFIAYPNNPTGNLFNKDDIVRIIEAAPGLVVLDEAYNPFAGGESFMPMLAQYPNLIVMRTVSKMGLAGLRFGYMAGHKDWMHEFDKVRMPYNINALTQASILFALQNKTAFDDQALILCEQRQRLNDALSVMPNVQKVFPSAANFILFKIDDAAKVFQKLKDAKILIKIIDKTGTPLEDCLRVTVGSPEENDAFLAALAQS